MINETKGFFYRAYGLNIKSDFKIKELLTLEKRYIGKIDVNVKFGEMPREIKLQFNEGKIKGYRRNNMWFLGGEEALFNVLNGDEIIVEPLKQYNLSLLKIYLLGIAFAMIMIQRENICIQGGAANIGDGAVIIMGKSGVGKSTLLDELRRRGYKLLADDMAVISIEHGEIVVNPSIPLQRLCVDTIEQLEDYKKNYEIVHLHKEKCLIPMNKTFQHQCKKLRAIIILTTPDINQVEIKEINGGDKLKQLLENIFRSSVLKEVGISPNYFKECVRITKTVPMYEIKRPNGVVTVDKQIELIEQLLK